MRFHKIIADIPFPRQLSFQHFELQEEYFIFCVQICDAKINEYAYTVIPTSIGYITYSSITLYTFGVLLFL